MNETDAITLKHAAERTPTTKEKHRMSDCVAIRKTPTSADLNAIAKVARETVLEIAKMDGALGHDEIAMLYVQRIYGAVVNRAVAQLSSGNV
jgi:hypothetical protein